MPSYIKPTDLKKALDCLNRGGVIAYPTEAVYGLGCDPFNPEAVNRLLHIKQRSADKGLILVAASWDQVEALTEPVPPSALAQAMTTWPGPFTWVFPSSAKTPLWIRGKFPSIALRVSAFPIIQELCIAYRKPIVSTSANRGGEPPLRDFRSMQIMFSNEVDFIVPGKVAGLPKPTLIRDILSGEVLR
ncbi:MAG: threonylcarbamoyl-AMP synthase [Proteobacteria bacterium]|nr:threonylcarbamoyl-AMP synthase [Pseudomonadota bacterium]